MKDSLFLKRLGTGLLLFAGAAGAAMAATTTYDSQSLFGAAAGSLTTINFSAPSGGYSVYATGLTLSGVTFTGTQAAGQSVNVTSQSFCCSTYARGFDSLNPSDSSFGPTATEGINVALPAGGTTAFGFSLFAVVAGDSTGTSQDLVDIGINGQTYTVDTATAPTAIFFGITSSTAITDVTITPEVSSVQIDIGNVEFGAAPTAPPTSVPEPATAWLTGLSSLAIAGGVVRSKKLLRANSV